MNILVGCEFSGAVRRAFRNLGFNAVSCDLLDTIDGSPHHLKGDIRNHLYDRYWDCAILFPPCTDLAVSGARHFAAKRASGVQQESIEFFMDLTQLDIPYAIENPVGIMSSIWRQPDQIIQPYMFGEDASKKTCLWLNKLPLLASTEMIEPRIVDGKPRWGNQTNSGQNKLGPSEDRAQIRGTTYEGIASAMACQWGNYLNMHYSIPDL